jgi:peptidoglycan/xylan/chitin deacetylase (PgdA/CDA1 family)
MLRQSFSISDGIAMPRLDRLVTLYFCHPLSLLLRSGCRDRIPILMYHSISENLFGKSHAYYRINTSPNIFAQQMKWLRDAGYHSLNCTEMLDALARGKDTSKCVVITFDDGYRDFYTDAFPALRRYGLTATVFLPTNRIHEEPIRVDGIEYLSWRDVRELHAQGVCFGSHTVNHFDLRSLGPDEIDHELGHSKEAIEDQIGSRVESFSYPFAFPEENRSFTTFLMDALMNNGFENGVSTILGRASRHSNKFFLPRLPVNSCDDFSLLRAKLEGGYDWLHWPQRLYKFVHHNASIMQQNPWARPSSAD